MERILADNWGVLVSGPVAFLAALCFGAIVGWIVVGLIYNQCFAIINGNGRGLAFCPVTISIFDLASWLGSLGRFSIICALQERNPIPAAISILRAPSWRYVAPERMLVRKNQWHLDRHRRSG